MIRCAPPFSAYLYTRSASTLHTLHLIMCSMIRSSCLPPGASSLFFFSGWLVVRISRARIHIYIYIYTYDPTEASGRKFLHAICRAAAYFGAHSDRRFAVDLSVTEARRGPLIWKYLVTVIKDTLGWTPSPFHCIDQGIFEERRSLLVDEPKRNDFIRE